MIIKYFLFLYGLVSQPT